MPLKEPPPPRSAEDLANELRMKEDARHPVHDFTQRPWTQSQPRDQKLTMEVNMFLRESHEAADRLCIRTCAYTMPDDARAALHAQYMLMIHVTHPHRILANGPPPLPDTTDNAGGDFPPAGATRLTIEHLNAKMCSLILKAITDPEFNQHLACIASDATKLKGRRASWLIHEISSKLEAGTFVMTFSVTLEWLQLRQSASQSMRNYLAASAAAQYCMTQCFIDKSSGNVDYKKLWDFLCTCQLYRNSCAAFQKVALCGPHADHDHEGCRLHLGKAHRDRRLPGRPTRWPTRATPTQRRRDRRPHRPQPG